MSFTFTNNPTVGNDNGTWGTILNTILSELKAAANTLETAVAGKAAASHNHDAAYAAIDHAHSALESAISTLQDESTDYESRITALENLSGYLNPNLTTVEVSADISNLANGISIKISTNPDVYCRRYNVEIKKDGNIIFTGGGSADVIFISDSYGFDDADLLQIRAQVISGESSYKYSSWYDHTYQNQAAPITLQGIIDSFKQDNDAMQELANVVHSSNTLAQKVAELLST